MFLGMTSPSSQTSTTRSRDIESVERTASFRAIEGRWPSATADGTGERELGVWLHKQRAAHAEGSIDPFRASALDQLLPGWLMTPDQLWLERAREVSNHVLANGRFPLSSSSSRAEKLGSLWVRTQRAHQLMGALRSDRNTWLAEHCPGWLTPKSPVGEHGA